MPDDGWRHMLCVEAAQVFEPIQVPPNGHWAGWQQLQVLDR
jgi:glucose-6-phosphate 1-epimerase